MEVKTYKVSDTLGNLSVEVNIPATLEGVTLPVGLSFRIAKRNIDDWLSKEIKEETLESNRNFYLYLLAEAISAFTKTDINICLAWSVEELLDEEGELLTGVLTKHIQKEKFERDYEGTENMLLMIFNDIDDLMSQYKYDPLPGSMNFKHNGVKYKVPSLVRILTMGKKVFGHIGTGQVVDIMKIKKYIAALDGYQADIKNKRNVTFTGVVQILSILAIPKGKKYPLNPEDATVFVQENALAFQDISFKTGSDIIFFLISHGGSSGKTLISNIISIRRNLTLAMTQSGEIMKYGIGPVTIQL